MELKKAMKEEDISMPSSTFFASEEQRSSLSFMELLGFQDFTSSSTSIFDLPHPVAPPPPSQPPSIKPPDITVAEVTNNTQPATPNNSSSVSSASSEALNEGQTSKVGEDNEVQKTKKQLKPKKDKKKEREPRFAFMTKSEVDHLEDGYRWRKYGQKAVKNSSFPRSYYRCTNASCNVKKRVERLFSDPSIVVTTYEGQHTHPSPLAPRPSIAPPSIGIAGAASAGSNDVFSAVSAQKNPAPHDQFDPSSYINCCQMSGSSHCFNSFPNAPIPPDRRFHTLNEVLLRNYSPFQDGIGFQSHMLDEV